MIMSINKITEAIIKASIEVHRRLGPGLLESVYQRCLAIELVDAGLAVQTEVAVPVVCKGHHIHDEGFRMDVLVEDAVVVELKSKEKVIATDKKQLITYLKLTQKPIGPLIDFSVPLLKQGITRLANNYEEESCSDPPSRRSAAATLSLSAFSAPPREISPEERP